LYSIIQITLFITAYEQTEISHPFLFYREICRYKRTDSKTQSRAYGLLHAKGRNEQKSDSYPFLPKKKLEEGELAKRRNKKKKGFQIPDFSLRVIDLLKSSPPNQTISCSARVV
jgi:hypothetical protein